MGAGAQHALDADGTQVLPSPTHIHTDIVILAQVDHRGRPSGLGKVSGQAVEAIMGGIFRQYVRKSSTSAGFF